jgi:uncharacterized protein YqeY
VDDGAQPAEVLRRRLASDLRAAMKARDVVAVATLRSLLSAIDNAGAVSETKAHVPVIGLSGDVPRKDLTRADLGRVLAAEASEREAAARDYEQRGLQEAAERLRAELAIITAVQGSLRQIDKPP